MFMSFFIRCSCICINIIAIFKYKSFFESFFVTSWEQLCDFLERMDYSSLVIWLANRNGTAGNRFLHAVTFLLLQIKTRLCGVSFLRTVLMESSELTAVFVARTGRGNIKCTEALQYYPKERSDIIPSHFCLSSLVGSGGRVVERWTVNRGDGGSIPPTAVSKLRQFRSPHICPCLSEEKLKVGGPFYLVSIPGEVKDPTQGVNV